MVLKDSELGGIGDVIKQRREDLPKIAFQVPIQIRPQNCNGLDMLLASDYQSTYCPDGRGVFKHLGYVA